MRRTKDGLPPTSQETHDLCKQPLPTRAGGAFPQPTAPPAADWLSQITQAGPNQESGVWTPEGGLVWESDREALVEEIKAKRLANMGDHRSWRGNLFQKPGGE
jgi:hypothetical protein